MASTYDEWFVDAKEDSSFHLTDLLAVESYLDGSIGLDDAVQELVEDEDCQDIGQTWVMLLVLAKRFPEVHERLVDLVKGIVAIPPPNDEEHPDEWTEEVVKNFGVNWRDVHDALWSDRRQISHAYDAAGQHWINYHAFSAACIRDGVLDDPYWAYVVIIDGFERKVRLPISPQQDVDIAAASQYFIHGACNILRNCQNKEGEKHGGWDDESELWKGEKGLSPERWSFWKERMGILSQTDGLTDETRDAARRAEVAIGKSDRKKKGTKN
ncbi:uncharacterized protein GIQ15_02808 [Arthroderma uncinatum]|uniref:uncharacterized protein n=1 Tax=Arthroderma uncinatum TaxID=74035 RepID=UPI00144AAA5B|nr:uncharacterized protein GIQ15_02808 [Arthroderma uncinatum]KAF3483484.1 hypothetical protein GIQ15_02808 [Arthroderma uncinatum]